MKGSCIVLQSGGPTAVINASLYGVLKQAKKSNSITNIYGALNGIYGVINKNLIDLANQKDEEIELLKATPGAILGSARLCLPEDLNNEIYQQILDTLVKLNVRYMFLIGGNDSMDTANKLSKFLKKVNYECNVFGVPKTIDNDLSVTDHSPGYGSAIKYVGNVFAEMKEDISCYKEGKVTIIEVMGRDAGWITAGSKLACLNGKGPDLIYLPEVAFDYDRFLREVSEIYKKQRHVVIAISEGIKDIDGNYVLDKLVKDNSDDLFGHTQLGGAATVLATLVKQQLRLPVRNVELNLPQRCATHMVSLSDVKEAIKCGEFAVKFALKGITGKMVAMKRISNNPYKISYTYIDLDEIANKVKEFPLSWIVNDNDISQEFIEYALPLIKGEIKANYQSGIVRFSKLDKTKVKLD